MDVYVFRFEVCRSFIDIDFHVGPKLFSFEIFELSIGLKKVTSDMQTHKNTALRSGPAPFKAPVSLPSPGSRPSAPVADKPPVFTRDGKKWLIVSCVNVLYCDD